MSEIMSKSTTRQLVPVGVTSAPGILNASTLQCLLGDPADDKDYCDDLGVRRDTRPASSELARIYGGDVALSPKRSSPISRKHNKRKPHLKLEPMRSPPQSSIVAVSGRRRASPEAVCSSGNKAVERKTSTFPDAQELQKCLQQTLHGVTERQEQTTHHLRKEIQWIHANFPVLRLATTKCSLALRQRLLATTVLSVLHRLELRLTLQRWLAVVAFQKAEELKRLRAFERITLVFERVFRCQVTQSFGLWKQWTLEDQEDEQCAAATAIALWFRRCRQLETYQAERLAVEIARAVEIADEKATVIQRAYRAHADLRRLRGVVHAAFRIRYFVRRQHQRKQEMQEAFRLELICAQVAREQALVRLFQKNEDRQARKIQQTWRVFVVWREELAQRCIDQLVDDVEFLAAVTSIQRHLRGYQCRFRIKRKRTRVSIIQRAWRDYKCKQMARQDRKMLRLHFEMAANCIQRTFRRNRERRIRRAVMQKSSRPIYLRAIQQRASFRERYYLLIVKSAASVIQSTWRKYLRRKRRKQQRDDAARILCVWTRQCIRLSRWKHAASHLAQQANEMHRGQAAGKISRWMAQQLDRHHCQNAQVAASMAQQLAEMLRAAMVIQRCHRRRHDRWRCVINSVMTEMLPSARQAAHCIQRAWQCYRQKQADRSALATVVQLQEQRRAQEELQQQYSQAASRIQRAYRRLVDRRHGKLLLKRYKIFYQKELLRKQQRQVIHRYLDEQQTSQHNRRTRSNL